MRILITGGSGFLGCHLVRRLTGEGHAVTLLASTRFRPARLAGIEGRYAVTVSLEEARLSRPEVIFHLASTPFNPPGISFDEHFRVTVGQTAALLDAFSGTGTRFIHAGSGAEYGSGTGFTETSPLAPATLVGACKAAASTLALALGRLGQIHAVVLRLFTPFGPWEAPHRLVPSVIRAACQGEPVRLQSPDSRRDFCYAGDVVEAMVRAATAPLPGSAVINICTGIATRAADMARMTLAVLGRPEEIAGEGNCRPDEISGMSGSTRTAERLLGWRPATPLPAGIERTVSWFQHNPHWLRIPG